MLTKEDLNTLQTMMETTMDKKLEPINERLDRMEQSLTEVRGAQNYLVEWVDALDQAMKQITR